jgi:hypothetical protein
MPVSREQFLLKVFASLELLECDRERTGLLVYVDGDAELYLTAHNLAEQSKFAERHCVQGNIPGERKEFSINTRRRRISAVHNATRKLINPCEYVFLIEDDGVLPPDALSRLLADYLAHPYAGFIEGVELGRWGIPHVGAWRADDVYDMKRLESAMPGSGVEEIDAGGLYACLTRFRQYVEHEFQPYEGCAFGPDIEWGIALRRQGYQAGSRKSRSRYLIRQLAGRLSRFEVHHVPKLELNPFPSVSVEEEHPRGRLCDCSIRGEQSRPRPAPVRRHRERR